MFYNKVYRRYFCFAALLVGALIVTLKFLLTSGGVCIDLPVNTDITMLKKSDEILEQRLKQHITSLSETIGPRHIGDPLYYQNLCKTAQYIIEEFKKIGFQPNITTYSAVYNHQKFDVQNIEVVIPGSTSAPNGIDTKNSTPYIVIGAHYDTVKTSPGADDNGSGVAVLIEIARHMYDVYMQLADKIKLQSTIKLVAFPNEEAPYSLDQQTGKSFGSNMGSVVYAQQAKANNDIILGMICLESIGYYSNEPGSQQYPGILKLLQFFYGNKGNFLMALSNRASKSFLNRFVKCFKQNKDAFPMHAQSLPDSKLTRDIGRSDHKSFWLQGYPALMLTDTANFRNKRYHTSSDTADSLNYKDFTKVAGQLCLTVERLAMQ